jgi:hypothetical protein
MYGRYLCDAVESFALGCVVHDEGMAFVVYRPFAMPKDPSQGCAKRTASGGLALTRVRRHGTSRA